MKKKQEVIELNDVLGNKQQRLSKFEDILIYRLSGCQNVLNLIV